MTDTQIFIKHNKQPSTSQPNTSLATIQMGTASTTKQTCPTKCQPAHLLQPSTPSMNHQPQTTTTNPTLQNQPINQCPKLQPSYTLRQNYFNKSIIPKAFELQEQPAGAAAAGAAAGAAAAGAGAGAAAGAAAAKIW